MKNNILFFSRITIDNFSFINDYATVTKAQLMDENRPLIYATQGRIKEYLLDEVNNNEKNEDVNNTPNSSKHSTKDEKKDDENDIEKENMKKKKN